MLPFEEARRRILADVPITSTERISLDDAIGRVLAQDIVAHAPRPPFDYSAMDGYVLAVEDIPAGVGPFALPVVGESRTGGEIPQRVEPGTACRIFTGAMIPTRGDAVVMQEDVTREGDRATFTKHPRRGENIRRAGEDIAQGERALAKGTRIGPNQIALLATLEHARLSVARKPIVTILSTGDELREAGELDRPGSVVDSNGPALAAWVRASGGEARRVPFLRDDRAAVRAAIESAIATSDLVLSVGGVSVGDHDVVKPALEDAGVTLDFWKVAIKPGKPLAVGHRGAKRFLGLPGNPASALLTFVLFGAPLLRAMQGDASPTPPLFRARLANELRHATGRLEFARARVRWDVNGPVVEPLAQQASGAIPSMAWADALVLLDADRGEFAAGSEVSVMRFADV
jgi:molybdopterin molybdotransferase